MWWRWIFASLLTAALVATLWPLAEPRQARRNVILVTVESTRADMIGPETTPNLLAAARSGASFSAHRAVSAWTSPNIVTLLTGLDSFRQGIHVAGDVLPADAPRPLRRLAPLGWEVIATQAFMLVEPFVSLGLAIEPAEEPMPALARAVLADRPVFLWYHYLGTHLPYDPAPAYAPDLDALLPPGDAAARARLEAVRTRPAIAAGSVDFRPGDRKAVVALHEGTLREFDAWFGRLWAFYRSSGLDRDTILVVTADHGEEHLERGQVGHASTTGDGHMFEEVLRIPLFVWVPGEPGLRGMVIGRPTDHGQVLPSLLSWLGLEPGPPPLLRREAGAYQGLTSRSGFAGHGTGWLDHFRAARIEGSWKLHLEIEAERIVRERLYALDLDPGETIDLAAAEPERAAAMRRHLEEAFRARSRSSSPSSPSPVAAATPPLWLEPRESRRYSYADSGGTFRIAWQGDPEGAYIVQYEAGRGPLSLRGELPVTGTEKVFTGIAETYWKSFILPYGKVRLRVRPAGSAEAWSEWIELEAVP